MTDRQVKTYVTEADYKRLQLVAVAADRSIANVLRLALREFLDRQTDDNKAAA